MKKLLNLFKKKEKHVIQIHECPEIFLINKQISWILEGCPNNNFKTPIDFNIYIYHFICGIIYNLIKDKSYNKDTISISIYKHNISVFLHQNGCKSYNFYSYLAIDTNIKKLQGLINNFKSNYDV